MIILGIIIGIYAYVLFFLGLTALLSSELVNAASVVFLGLILIALLKDFKRHRYLLSTLFPKSLLSYLLFSLLVVMSLVNLIGSLGPELAFDALWYHLTLPKLYLLKQTLVFIPGGLLYYSAMPKLVELLYVGGLAFGGEAYPKVIHWFFGLFTLVLIYKSSRLYVSEKLSLFACVVFYANLVVAWESITAFVDLMWTFFASGNIYLLLRFINEKKKKLLYLSGVFVGLAISVKILAVGSLFLVLLTMLYLKLSGSRSYTLEKKDFFIVIFGAVIIPLPWFILSFIHTGNPFYPIFSSLLPSSFSVFSLRNIIETFSVFLFSSDPISPIYVLCLPLVILFYKHFSQKEGNLLILSGIALAIWFLTPKSGGGRFILAFLPLFSVIVAVVLSKVEKQKSRYLSITILAMAIFVMVISIGYRIVANSRYVPVILRNESKAEFLSKHLIFSFGDFYDTDGYFAQKIKKDETVLLVGFHNLYYIDFPYIDQSWIQRGDIFNYVAVQNGTLPNRFSSMKKIYQNNLTGVSLYGEEGKIWTY